MRIYAFNGDCGPAHFIQTTGFSGNRGPMAVTKAVLRREAARRRQSAFAAAPADCAGLMADHVLAFVEPLLDAMGPVAIGGYVAIRTEADPAPVLARLRSLGVPIVLPRIAGSDLVFHAHDEGQALVPGPHGTLEPPETAPVLIPSILIVPSLAFDYAGMRLGYGGGYYDRALRALRAAGPVRAIGLAFEAQKSDLLPREASDEPLDAVATEVRLREFRRG